MDHWTKVFETKELVRAEIARSVLEANGINAVLLNKQSSSYVIFGLCEVHVPAEDAETAKNILSHEATFGEAE